MMFAAEAGLKIEEALVDITQGAHFQPEYLAVNPNAPVPVLEDGDFRLTEGSAILKYVADMVE
jgi:glutathione S-transferase